MMRSAAAYYVVICIIKIVKERIRALSGDKLRAVINFLFV